MTRAILLAAVGLWSTPTLAENVPAGLAYCALYAREATRIDLMHTIPVKPEDVSDGYVVALAVKVFNECKSLLPALLPLPEAHRSLDSWKIDMRYMLTERDRAVTSAGTVPATGATGDEEWRRQCAAEYRTFDPADGTVVRRGSPERVRCPCGGEVECKP